ncbi:hypothetical protein HDU80_005031 [Chytriomyces hyalinus]|nr:hypothetical protein HDU80_005031 [Chytriomyces hyalinus]
MEGNASAVFDDIDAQLSVLREIEVAGAGVSAALLVALIATIRFELRAANASITVRTVFNPFNASLLLMGCSLVILQIAGSLYTDVTLHLHTVRFLAVYCLLHTFTYMAQYGYMLYSWHRGAAVLRHMLPRYTTYFGAILVVAPVLFAAAISVDMYMAYLILDGQNVPPAIDTLWAALIFLPGITIVIYDVTMLVTFTVFTASTKYQKELDPRFLIISRYGIAATAFTIGTFTTYVVSCTLVTDYVLSRAMFVTITILMQLCFITLFAMKVALFNESRRKQTNQKEMLHRVLGPEAVTLIRVQSQGQSQKKRQPHSDDAKLPKELTVSVAS